VTGRIDFLVSDGAGLLTLFENKLRVATEQQLQKAVDQAKSYALMLGLPSFVVASPEGLRLYSLSQAEETLVGEMSPGAGKSEEESFRSAILGL
jgi:hypothetical protein